MPIKKTLKTLIVAGAIAYSGCSQEIEKTTGVNQSTTIPTERVKANEDLQTKIQIRFVQDHPSLTGIPKGDVREYIARDVETKTNLYVVHRPREWQGYSSFRLHIGPAIGLREVKVRNVERLRDGGTTTIDYTLDGVEGALYFPTPVEPEKKPTDTYKGKTIELEKLKEVF